jgi:hypothetical protein
MQLKSIKQERKMEYNSCARLVNQETYAEASKFYDDLIKDGKNPTQTMFDLQLNLQNELAEKLPKHNPKIESLQSMGDMLDYIQRQDDSIADETRELYTAMGEMSRGEKDATAIFKPWKTRHDEARNKQWDDVSDADQLEVLFEMIDQMHFVMVKMLTLKLDAKDMFVLYYLKQQENMKRYNSGY